MRRVSLKYRWEFAHVCVCMTGIVNYSFSRLLNIYQHLVRYIDIRWKNFLEVYRSFVIGMCIYIFYRIPHSFSLGNNKWFTRYFSIRRYRCRNPRQKKKKRYFFMLTLEIKGLEVRGGVVSGCVVHFSALHGHSFNGTLFSAFASSRDVYANVEHRA